VVRPDWREAVLDDHGRVERVGYELCALVALREAIRRREIWIVGAAWWRNPDTDLPPDFDTHRDVHYTAIATIVVVVKANPRECRPAVRHSAHAAWR
jgi:hypothetical protein